MTEVTLIETVSADSLTKLLQDAGCRVNRTEQNAVVQLLSASQGVGYAVRFGNRALNQEGEFLDFTFSCALRIQGELPAGLAERWNATRRFARLSVQGEFLVMERTWWLPTASARNTCLAACCCGTACCRSSSSTCATTAAMSPKPRPNKSAAMR